MLWGVAVFAKLVVLILVIGSCGGSLLAMRQSRLQAAHELAEARLRLRDHEERLQRLRAEIAVRATPEAVRDMLEHRGDDVGPLVPAAERRARFARPELMARGSDAGAQW